MIYAIIATLVVGALAVAGLIIAIMLRVVVPTNMVHIVQSTKSTTSYGRGKPAGNTYYAIPFWVPKYGVTVTEFPESIFQVVLTGYDAYDSARLPFVVDVSAFFRIENSETAAQRVASFAELNHQLESVLQGSVRRILATNHLEDIMQERSKFGDQFTQEVEQQIAEWGVKPVKMIEFLDLKDSRDSKVIANIMEKEKSRIEMESRIKVAENRREAELREIDAARVVQVQQQDAEQQVGIRTAEKEKAVGIATEQASQEVQAQQKVTTEREMDVVKVRTIKTAEIERDAAIILAEQQKKVAVVDAEAERETTVVKATGELEASKLDAEGIRLVGQAEGEAERAKLQAPVDTQISLAKEIGSNEAYQEYLVTLEKVKAQQAIGVEMAKAIGNADLKVIANSGDIQSGVTTLADAFTAKGGLGLGAMLEGMAQTPEGKALVSRFTGAVTPVDEKKPAKATKPAK